MLKKLIVLILLFIVPKICYSYEIRFDKHMSASSLAVNTKLGSNLFGNAIEKSDIPLTLRVCVGYMFNSKLEIFGHEFSHGEIYRRLNLTHVYDFSFKDSSITTVMFKQPIKIHSHVKINGLRFEKLFRDEIRKDQIMKNINYKNSNMLMVNFLKNISRVCKTDYRVNSDDDYYTYSKVLETMNYSTDLTLEDIKNTLNVTLFDPLTVFSLMNTGVAFFGKDVNIEVDSLPAIPIIDYNLYPDAVTLEVSLAKKWKNTHYIKVSLEKGKNVYNKKIIGGSLEITNIKIWKFKVNQKIHYVDTCMGSIGNTLVYENYYVGYDYNFKKISDIISKFEVFGGFYF